MAGKSKTSIGYEFTGDASGFQKAAGQVGKSQKELARESAKSKKEIVGSFDEMGSSIGGAVGDIVSGITSLITSGGPLALMTAAVGAVAAAWGESQKNLELYLKTADKLKYGFAGYSKDALKERRATVDRAEGMIANAVATKRRADILADNKTLTDEQKRQVELMREQADLQLRDAQTLANSVLNFQERAKWELAYNKLLQEQEATEDRINGVDKVRWQGMETELNNQRLISKQSTDTKEVEKAKTEAARIASQLQTEKLASLDEELRITRELAKLTGTEEAVEDRIFSLLQEKASVTTEYSQDLLKIDRFFKEGAKVTKEQLAILKEFYATDSKGYHAKNAPVSGTTRINVGAGKIVAPGQNDLRGFGGLTIGEINAIVEENKFQQALEGIQGLVGGVQGAFASMFASISSGSGTAFADMAKSFGRALNQMAAQMASKALIFGILNLLTGGTGKVAKFASGLLGGKGFGEFMGFANGTNFAPGGLALVGERGPELVNLPRGAQVIPNNALGGEVLIRFQNGSLEGYMNYQSRKAGSYR